jgi:hypothetical protein
LKQLIIFLGGQGASEDMLPNIALRFSVNRIKCLLVAGATLDQGHGVMNESGYGVASNRGQFFDIIEWGPRRRYS